DKKIKLKGFSATEIDIGNWTQNLPVSQLVFVTGPPGPRPHSLPRPGLRPGAGPLFVHPLPLPPSRSPPRLWPRTGPRSLIIPGRGPAFLLFPVQVRVSLCRVSNFVGFGEP